MCPRSVVPLLARPSFVSEPVRDDATAAFLLARSLAARQQEEEEAKELAEVEELEEKVNKLELVLVLEAKAFHELPRRDLSNLQGLVLDWA